jgi:hypothetical protein
LVAGADEGDWAIVDGTTDGPGGVGTGDAHPASRAQSRARAKGFIVR